MFEQHFFSGSFVPAAAEASAKGARRAESHALPSAPSGGEGRGGRWGRCCDIGRICIKKLRSHFWKRSFLLSTDTSFDAAPEGALQATQQHYSSKHYFCQVPFDSFSACRSATAARSVKGGGVPAPPPLVKPLTARYNGRTQAERTRGRVCFSFVPAAAEASAERRAQG